MDYASQSKHRVSEQIKRLIPNICYLQGTQDLNMNTCIHEYIQKSMETRTKEAWLHLNQTKETKAIIQ